MIIHFYKITFWLQYPTYKTQIKTKDYVILITSEKAFHYGILSHNKILNYATKMIRLPSVINNHEYQISS